MPDAASLASRLVLAGVALEADEVDALLRGIAASPVAAHPERWLSLWGDSLPPSLRMALAGHCLTLRPHPREARGDAVAERLDALRGELKRQALDGFIVPRADEHQGEYVPARAERLAWLTGFTGSAGFAVILPDRAAVFTDGRYTLQVQAEVPATLYECHHSIDEPLSGWLPTVLKAGTRVGYDPWLHTQEWVEKLAAALTRHGIRLEPVGENLVDAIWGDQPPAPLGPVEPHPLDYAGLDSVAKRTQLGEELLQGGADAVVLTQPDSIAWLLNLRGADVPHTPLPLGFAVLFSDGQVDLCLDRRKLVPEAWAHLSPGVRLHPPEALAGRLAGLGYDRRRVRVDPATTAAWVFDRLAEGRATVVRGADPCTLPKACKQPAELEGARAAHRRDAVAMVRFLAWLETAAPEAAALGTPLRESQAATRLETLRRSAALFRDLSFPTISAAGPNGAIVHYRVTPETDRPLEPGCVYLVDSGAQYLDGTTDITRTVVIGAPIPAMARDYTLVLKGHIAISRARFPAGTTGSQLDVLARLPLWRAGFDYDHGTGHGVGSYLSVHEGPQRISKAGNTIALRPGMVLSNEPGCYRAGAWGIRIENLVAVCNDPHEEDDRSMLAFETLTLVPYARLLIRTEMLDPEERAWIDDYHSRVQEILSPLLEPAVVSWLAEATRPLT